MAPEERADPGRPGTVSHVHEDAVVTRPADPSEAQVLGDLALRSKAHWGYSPEFLEACRGELSYGPSQMESPDWKFAVAEIAAAVVAFYALERVSTSDFELAALFVEPARIGQGIGRLLMSHAEHQAARLGGKVLTIQSDPHAAGFYRAVGAVPVGTRESASIPGRWLPVFSVRLACSGAA